MNTTAAPPPRPLRAAYAVGCYGLAAALMAPFFVVLNLSSDGSSAESAPLDVWGAAFLFFGLPLTWPVYLGVVWGWGRPLALVFAALGLGALHLAAGMGGVWPLVQALVWASFGGSLVARWLVEGRRQGAGAERGGPTGREWALAGVVCLGIGGLTGVARGDLERGFVQVDPAEARPRVSGARRVLFIGNSLVRYNALPMMFEALARQAGHPVQATLLARDGESLAGHWETGVARELIEQGGWDDVVLQESSWLTLSRPDLLVEATRAFDAVIRAQGARTFVLSSWHTRLYARPIHPQTVPLLRLLRALGWKMLPLSPDLRFHVTGQPAVDDGPPLPLQLWTVANAGAAERVDAPLVPMAEALLHTRLPPEWPPLHPDGNHPTLAGSYLAACLLFGTLLGDDPEQIPGGIGVQLSSDTWQIELPAEVKLHLRSLAGAVLRAPAPTPLDEADDAAWEALAAIHAAQGRPDAAEAARAHRSDPR